LQLSKFGSLPDADNFPTKGLILVTCYSTSPQIKVVAAEVVDLNWSWEGSDLMSYYWGITLAIAKTTGRSW
jgi:hypothetical protein